MRLPLPDRHGRGSSPVELALEIGRDALEAADRDRLVLDAAAAAGRLAGPIADAAEDAGKDVGVAVQQVGIGVAPLRDQPDVLRDVGVRRAGPLTVYHAMVIIRVRSIGRIHGVGDSL